MTFDPSNTPIQPSFPAPDEPRRWNLMWVIPTVAAAAVGVFGAGWWAGHANDDNPPRAVSAAPAADPLAVADGAEIGIPDDPAPETTTPAGPELSAADITLTPKITEKNCFGSAGCNVSVKVHMAYRGPALAEDDTFEVTYQLTGDENGPIIGTFAVTGPSYTQDEQSLSTTSSSTKIAATVTGVERTL